MYFFPKPSADFCAGSTIDDSGSRNWIARYLRHGKGHRSLRRRVSRRDVPSEIYRVAKVAKRRGGRDGKKRARYFGGYARGPCRAIKLRNGGSPLDVWRELHSLVKASRNSRRYRHRRGYINVSSYVLTAYPSPRAIALSSISLFTSLPRSRSLVPSSNFSVCLMYVHQRGAFVSRLHHCASAPTMPRRLLVHIMRYAEYIVHSVCSALPPRHTRVTSL